MMKLKKKLNSLSYTLKLANASRKRIETLFSKKLLKNNDVVQLYKGLYINSVVAFELFVEDVFIGLLCSKYSIRGVKTNVSFASTAICYDALCGGKSKYIDWLPYGKTMNIAYIYFANGLPFSKIRGTDYNNLELLSKVRNFIAHGSDASKKSYLTQLSQQMSTVQNRYKDPVVYLRDYYSYPNQTYYEQIFSNMLSIANKLITP